MYESSASKNDLEQLEITVSLPLKLLIGNKLPFLLDMKKLFSRYGMMTEVIQILQVLDRLRPYDEDVQWQLAQAYTKVNDFDKAILAYKTIREITPLYDGLILIKMGEIYINNMREFKKGVDAIEEAIDFIDTSLRKGTEILAMDVDENTRVDILIFLCNACININDVNYVRKQQEFALRALQIQPHNPIATDLLDNANIRLTEMQGAKGQP